MVVWTLVKTKCFAEKWGILLLYFYVVSAAFRSFNWTLHWIWHDKEDRDQELISTIENIIDCFDEITVILTWTMLYYFIFEMMDLRNKFECETPQQYFQ